MPLAPICLVVDSLHQAALLVPFKCASSRNGVQWRVQELLPPGVKILLPIFCFKSLLCGCLQCLPQGCGYTHHIFNV
jgi:hypothetical protein